MREITDKYVDIKQTKKDGVEGVSTLKLLINKMFFIFVFKSRKVEKNVFEDSKNDKNYFRFWQKDSELEIRDYDKNPISPFKNKKTCKHVHHRAANTSGWIKWKNENIYLWSLAVWYSIRIPLVFLIKSFSFVNT